MYIPDIEHITDITPEQFEKYAMQILNDMSPILLNYKIAHDEKITTSDGEYQIDITVRFDVFGVTYLTLVECKMHKAAIKREIVQVLYDKIRSIGAQKGILFSTASFQRGAISYAKAHGIALIQIIDGKLTYETRSLHEKPIEPPPWAKIPKYLGVLVQEISASTIQCSSDDACLEGLIKFLTSQEFENHE